VLAHSDIGISKIALAAVGKPQLKRDRCDRTWPLYADASSSAASFRASHCYGRSARFRRYIPDRIRRQRPLSDPWVDDKQAVVCTRLITAPETAAHRKSSHMPVTRSVNRRASYHRFGTEFGAAFRRRSFDGKAAWQWPGGGKGTGRHTLFAS